MILNRTTDCPVSRFSCSSEDILYVERMTRSFRDFLVKPFCLTIEKPEFLPCLFKTNLISRGVCLLELEIKVLGVLTRFGEPSVERIGDSEGFFLVRFDRLGLFDVIPTPYALQKRLVNSISRMTEFFEFFCNILDTELFRKVASLSINDSLFTSMGCDFFLFPFKGCKLLTDFVLPCSFFF